jgi:hypothetical protein
MQFNAKKYLDSVGDGVDAKTLGITQDAFDLDTLVADLDKRGVVNDVHYSISSGEIEQGDGILHIRIQ